MTLKLNGSTAGSVSIDAPADTSPTGTDVTLTLPTSAGSSGQYLQTNGSGTLSWQTVEGLPDAIDVNASAPADSVNLDASGRLLVGSSTNNAGYRLQVVHSDNGVLLGCFNGGVNYLSTLSSNGSEASKTIVTNGQNLFTINATGYDGSANRTAATISAQVDGTPGSNDMPGRLVFSTTADGASSPTNRLRIGNQGQHSLLSADYGLIVRSESAASGVIEAIYVARSATTLDNGQGVFAVYTNGSYATLSDQTQKKNIETTRDGYLEDLNRLRVVKYNWNEQEDDEPKELGLIAQEVEQVFPGLISEMSSVDGETEEETSTKSIKYSVLPVMLLKALQEADQKIEAQSALIASQAATIAALDARLTALEGGAS